MQTFLINNLYGMSVGVTMGTLSHTRGISFVIPQHLAKNHLQGAVLVDTAGTNQPTELAGVLQSHKQQEHIQYRKVCYHSSDCVRVNAADHAHITRTSWQISDAFVQEVAQGLASVLIIVVNRLTLADQVSIWGHIHRLPGAFQLPPCL